MSREAKGNYEDGMFCSRQFANWMLKKNETDVDIPATSYYKLIRLFSRSQYNEFFVEEARKGNEFFYNVVSEGGKIRLERSYEIVFLPYKGRIGKKNPDFWKEATEPQPVNKFIFGYRILQTRGCLPGSADDVFEHRDFFSFGYLVDEVLLRADNIEKFAKEKGVDIDHVLKYAKEHQNNQLGYNVYSAKHCYSDLYRIDEFQRAERRGFIDNEPLFSCGPQCPDKLICLLSYTRIINRLMKDIDKLGLVSKDMDLYELRVAAFAAAIISLVHKDDDAFLNGIKKGRVSKKAEELFASYLETTSKNPEEVCKRIRIGLLWDVTVVIDFSQREEYDCDNEDLKTAPIGLTDEDREEFDKSIHKCKEINDIYG